MQSELLVTVKAQVESRLAELEPAYKEYVELKAYHDQMGGFESPIERAEREAREAEEAAAEAARQAELAAAQAELDSTPALVAPPVAEVAPLAVPKNGAKKPAAARQRPGSKAKPKAKAVAKPAANDGETVARIKEIVEGHDGSGGISVGDIIKEGELSQSYTYDVVKRLTENGELVKRNRKIYTGTVSATRTPVGSSQPAEAQRAAAA